MSSASPQQTIAKDNLGGACWPDVQSNKSHSHRINNQISPADFSFVFQLPLFIWMFAVCLSFQTDQYFFHTLCQSLSQTKERMICVSSFHYGPDFCLWNKMPALMVNGETVISDVLLQCVKGGYQYICHLKVDFCNPWDFYKLTVKP